MKDKRAADLLRRLAQIAGSAQGPFENWNRTQILFQEWFTLNDDAAEAYEGIVSELLHKDGFEQRFSRKYVSASLSRIVTAFVDGKPESAKDLLTKLAGEFKTFAVKHTIYFPLAGIEMALPSLDFGSVQLVKLDRQFFERGFDLTRIPATDFVPVYARSEVVAETERAFEVAEQRTHRVLDLLRYTLPFAKKRPSRPHQVRVGLNGEIQTKFHLSFAECTESENNVVRRAGSGPLQGLPVDAEWVGLMRSIGVFEVAALLNKSASELTDYEKALVRGLHWAANAQTQVEPENELLNLVTALETYFTPRDRDPVTAAVAEGVAFLLGKTKMERIALKKDTRVLYGRRSAVSHGGQTAVEPTDLFRLTEIARDVTKRLIERRSEFTSRNDLLDWVEDKKMAC